MVILLAVAMLAQDPAVALVEQLRSGDIEKRDLAVRKLKELGKTAKPALEEAAKSAQGADAILFRQLLERVRIVELLPPAVQEAMPGVADRLAFGLERDWVDVFVEAESLQVDPDEHRRPVARLKRKDLEPLAPEAARAAKSA